jgi:hypothetical protein
MPKKPSIEVDPGALETIAEMMYDGWGDSLALAQEVVDRLRADGFLAFDEQVECMAAALEAVENRRKRNERKRNASDGSPRSPTQGRNKGKPD